MTDGEMRLQGQEIVNMIRNLEISDNEILGQIKEKSYLVEIKLMSGRNLFMEAVDSGRIDLTKALKELGSDINLRCIGSGTCGNAMNLAKTNEMVEYLLEIGVEVIQCFELRENAVHPVMSFASWNQIEMVDYWRKKEKSMSTAPGFIHDMDFAVAKQISMMNQHDGLEYLLKDDELYSIYMNEIRPEESADSMKFIRRALKELDNPDLADRIKEICKRK